jgi:hypothetical protein
MQRALLALIILTVMAAGLATLPLTVACGAAAVDASVSDCSDIDAGNCFSNEDCADGMHCAFSGLDAGLAVKCCIAGPRGTVEAGAPCMSLDDCPTAVCTFTADFQSTVCSPECHGNADCPSDIPVCSGVPTPDGGTRSFCGIP